MVTVISGMGNKFSGCNCCSGGTHIQYWLPAGGQRRHRQGPRSPAQQRLQPEGQTGTRSRGCPGAPGPPATLSLQSPGGPYGSPITFQFGKCLTTSDSCAVGNGHGALSGSGAERPQETGRQAERRDRRDTGPELREWGATERL